MNSGSHAGFKMMKIVSFFDASKLKLYFKLYALLKSGGIGLDWIRLFVLLAGGKIQIGSQADKN